MCWGPLSWGNPLYAEWRFHPDIVRLVWEHYGWPSVDLLQCRRALSVLCFSPFTIKMHLWGWTQWLTSGLVFFCMTALISPTLARVREEGELMILIAPCWLSKHWLVVITQLLYRESWPICRDLHTCLRCAEKYVIPTQRGWLCGPVP